MLFSLWGSGPWSFCLSVFLFCFSVFLSFCLSVFLSFCLSVFLSFSLSLFLSFSLSLFLSFSLSLFLSFSLSPVIPLSFLPTFFAALFFTNNPFLPPRLSTLPPFPLSFINALLFPSFLVAPPPLSLVQRPPTIHFSTLFSPPHPFFNPLFSSLFPLPPFVPSLPHHLPPPTLISISIFNPLLPLPPKRTLFFVSLLFSPPSPPEFLWKTQHVGSSVIVCYSVLFSVIEYY